MKTSTDYNTGIYRDVRITFGKFFIQIKYFAFMMKIIY